MELVKQEDRKNLPIISRQIVEKAEMLIKASERELTQYRVGIIVHEAVGDSMAYLIAKEVGIKKDVVCAIIERLLAGLALSLNVGKNLEPYQLAPLSVKIYAKYYYLSFDEIMYVFDKGSSGQYGKIYDRIDEEIILGWLSNYDTGERLEIASKKHNQDIEQSKMSSDEINILSKVYEKVIQDQEAEKVKEENFKKFREQYFKTNENERDKI